MRAKERDEAIGKYNTSLVDNLIITESAKKGITDLDAAKKLIERATIKVNEDGTVTGVTEAVDALVKDKPYLVGGKREVWAKERIRQIPKETQESLL